MYEKKKMDCRSVFVRTDTGRVAAEGKDRYLRLALRRLRRRLTAAERLQFLFGQPTDMIRST